jgi:hypothetical protein
MSGIMFLGRREVVLHDLMGVCKVDGGDERWLKNNRKDGRKVKTLHSQ